MKAKFYKNEFSFRNGMGQLKTFLLTCLGVGLAAGAGFYLYRKFTSTDGEEENSENTATQVTVKKNIENETNLNQNLDMKLKNLNCNNAHNIGFLLRIFQRTWNVTIINHAYLYVCRIDIKLLYFFSTSCRVPQRKRTILQRRT